LGNKDYRGILAGRRIIGIKGYKNLKADYGDNRKEKGIWVKTY
jgi:hypothetical protein